MMFVIMPHGANYGSVFPLSFYLRFILSLSLAVLSMVYNPANGHLLNSFVVGVP